MILFWNEPRSMAIFMVSSKEKPMSARALPPSRLDFGVSVLVDFAGCARTERTFETDVASSECNTVVFLLWISLVCTVCVVLSLV